MSCKLKKNKNKTSIGGQAVIEGVMMRSGKTIATAVRDADGIIRVESKRLAVKKHNVISKLPLIRGVASFTSSLVDGSKVLMRSAEVFGEGEPSKFEKWLAEKLKINIMGVVTSISLILGLALAVFLFMWLPQFSREQLEVIFSCNFDVWAKNFIEGGLKLLIFVCYILRYCGKLHNIQEILCIFKCMDMYNSI